MAAAFFSCTVVICTRDRPELLERCLASVARLTYPDFDVLVVDNAPSDERARLASEHHGVRYLREPIRGLSRARNRGARAAASEIVAFLDDDAVPDPTWLGHLILEFQDPAVMAVTGRIVPLDMPVESEWLRTWWRSLDGGDVRRVVDRHVPAWFEMANFGGVGDGGNMAIRRSAFELWPGFHPRLGRGVLVAGGEEHHAFFSLIARGYRVVYAPRARVWHPYPSTVRGCRQRMLRDRMAASGYMALLLVEEPAYRGAVIRYFAQWLAGHRRAWRAHPLPPGLRLVPTWRVALACLSGPAYYIWSRLVARAPTTRGHAGSARAGVEILDSAR